MPIIKTLKHNSILPHRLSDPLSTFSLISALPLRPVDHTRAWTHTFLATLETFLAAIPASFAKIPHCALSPHYCPLCVCVRVWEKERGVEYTAPSLNIHTTRCLGIQNLKPTIVYQSLSDQALFLSSLCRQLMENQITVIERGAFDDMKELERLWVPPRVLCRRTRKNTFLFSS